ncbi:MAG: trypsin-like peptidase domain-containing protein [Desulfobulbaceae bacterium]|nr:trypsin-like peptidase domain-containing protein [Desulfobulbaceae bacterium]
MDWDQVVQKVNPYIVKIETPSGYGTGFLSLYNEDKSWCGIATAAHVVGDADEWQKPIKIIHHESGEVKFLQSEHRVIYLDWKTDSAVILFFKDDFKLPEIPITLFPVDTPLGIGVEVGWLGFPNIEANTLCFFSGNVSARQEFRNAYLIDGVSINGISGGTVLHMTKTEGVQVIGIVSAYRANRATGEALPGLLIAQDVSHFHNVLQHVKSIDEANKKKRELEAQKTTEEG